ncbi:MAG: GGDEF domain-containing protein [Gammaproteobacteria bacterium]|nr:GGDEF domain-containing protein [Gammaproteobacteria bacterium]
MRHSTVSTHMLAALALFEDEQADTLARIATHCYIEQVPAQTILLSPKRPQDRVFVILEGEVEVRLGRQADEIIAILGHGQCVGEMSVIENLPPSAQVITRTVCRVVAIEGASLRALLETSNVVARNLLRLMARRLRRDNLLVRQSRVRQAASEQHARTDALTGLHNRRWLDETLLATLEYHRTHARQLTLLMLDIDRFKQFNDNYGHPAGDLALTTVANTLQLQLRDGDHVARYGGEEFLILLPDTGTEDALVIAERLRMAVRSAPINSQLGIQLPNVTLSIGLAEWTPEESMQALIKRADDALYQSKCAGRDCVATATLSTSHRLRPTLRRHSKHAPG